MSKRVTVVGKNLPFNRENLCTHMDQDINIIIYMHFQQQRRFSEGFHLSLLLLFMFCFVPSQLLWRPAYGFLHISRWVFPRSPAELSREPERMDRRQMEELGDPLQCKWRCWESFQQMLQGRQKMTETTEGNNSDISPVCLIDTELSKWIFMHFVLF